MLYKKPSSWSWSIITWHLLTVQQSTEQIWNDSNTLWICISSSVFQNNYLDTKQRHKGFIHKNYSVPFNPNSSLFFYIRPYVVEDQKACLFCFSQTLSKSTPDGLLNFLLAEKAKQVYFHSINWYIYLGLLSQLIVRRMELHNSPAGKQYS